MSNKFMVAKIIQFALIVSLIIYGVLIVIVTQQQSDQFTPLLDDFMRIVLSSIGFMMYPLAFMIHRIWLTPSKLKDKDQPLSFFLTTHIIVWAIFESGSICGLVMGFLTHDLYDYIPFAILSIIGILTHSASEDKFNRLMT